MCNPALVVLWLSWLLLQPGKSRFRTGEPPVGARASGPLSGVYQRQRGCGLSAGLAVMNGLGGLVHLGVGGPLAALAASSVGEIQVPDKRTTQRRAGLWPAFRSLSTSAGLRLECQACRDEWPGWIYAPRRWCFFGCPGCFFSRGKPESRQENHPSARGPLARFQESINISGVAA